jgi:hypothetical protein
MQNNHQCVIRAAGICFALAGLTASMILAVRGRDSQEAGQTKLSVKGARPVAEAIEMLEKKYGWVITYEDPRYAHESDLVDAALEVRRDLDKYKPGKVPPVFIPKGGTLEFTYDVASNTNLPANPVTVVQKLLNAQALKDNGGRFRLEGGGKIIHVIPTAVKNKEGKLAPQESVLDTIISLPAKERTVYEKLERVCEAISQATKVPVYFGTISENWFRREKDQQGAEKQKARDVLVNTFEKMYYGTNLSWRLLYSPAIEKKYFLNIHLVSKPKSEK